MTQSPMTAVRIQAPLKTVFHALTDPAEMRVWFAEHAEVDLPSRYEFWGRYTRWRATPPTSGSWRTATT